MKSIIANQQFLVSYYALRALSFEADFLRLPRPSAASAGAADSGAQVSSRDFTQSCEDTYSRCIEVCKVGEWTSSDGFDLPFKFESNLGVAPDIRPINHICDLLVSTVEQQGGGRYIPPWWLAGSLWGPEDTAGLTSPDELSELTRQMHAAKFLEVVLGSRSPGKRYADMLISLAHFFEQQTGNDVWLLGARKESQL